MQHRHRLGITALLCMALTACAVDDSRPTGRTDMKFSSKRPSKDVAQCISGKWRNSQFFGPPLDVTLEARADDAYNVTLLTPKEGPYPARVDFLAEVTSSDGGSATHYYEAMLTIPRPAMQEAVVQCQQ